MYPACNLIAFVVRILPANDFESSDDIRISHIALLLLAKTFTEMLRLFRASYIPPLLTQLNFLDLTSVVNRDIFLVLTASITEAMDKSSLPAMKSLYSSLRAL